MKNKVYKILSLLVVILFLAEPHLAQSAEIIVTDSHTPFIDDPLCKCNSSDCAGTCPVPCGRQYIFQAFDVGQDVAFNGGEAQNAVASGTITGTSAHGCPFSLIHRPEFVNDGYYGNGSSWVASGSNPWLKIDLGGEVLIDGVMFGRERVVTNEGPFNDRDPGRFIIAVASTDDIYENGNESNDNVEYFEIIDSNDYGFSGYIDGPQTVEVSFEPVLAKYVKLMFFNYGVAIDEVEIRRAPESQNIALNKPASTNKNIYIDNWPSKAVDGEITTLWAADHHGNPYDPTWLKVDLEGVFDIEQIVLKVRDWDNQFKGFYIDYILYSSADGQLWEEIGRGRLIDFYDPIDTIDPNGDSMRYLRFDVIGGTHWAGLHEMEVYGEEIINDSDGDGIPDSTDNCPADPNPDQEDLDGDGDGDVCDSDDDDDGVEDVTDNCPIDYNPDQADADFDTVGDACDVTFNTGAVVDALESKSGASVDSLIEANPPGVNGMIKKIAGKGSVIEKIAKAEEDYANGDIDTATYIDKLNGALAQLDDYDTQLTEKIASDHIVEPEASELQEYSANMREMINNLISDALSP